MCFILSSDEASQSSNFDQKLLSPTLIRNYYPVLLSFSILRISSNINFTSFCHLKRGYLGLKEGKCGVHVGQGVVVSQLGQRRLVRGVTERVMLLIQFFFFFSKNDLLQHVIDSPDLLQANISKVWINHDNFSKNILFSFE